MEEQGVGAGGGTDTGMPQLPKGWVLGLVNLQHSEWLGRERETERESVSRAVSGHVVVNCHHIASASCLRSPTQDVRYVAGSFAAFAALKSDGSVVSWGDRHSAEAKATTPGKALATKPIEAQLFCWPCHDSLVFTELQHRLRRMPPYVRQLWSRRQ